MLMFYWFDILFTFLENIADTYSCMKGFSTEIFDTCGLFSSRRVGPRETPARDVYWTPILSLKDLKNRTRRLSMKGAEQTKRTSQRSLLSLTCTNTSLSGPQDRRSLPGPGTCFRRKSTPSTDEGPSPIFSVCRKESKGWFVQRVSLPLFTGWPDTPPQGLFPDKGKRSVKMLTGLQTFSEALTTFMLTKRSSLYRREVF